MTRRLHRGDEGTTFTRSRDAVLQAVIANLLQKTSGSQTSSSQVTRDREFSKKWGPFLWAPKIGMFIVWTLHAIFGSLVHGPTQT